MALNPVQTSLYRVHIENLAFNVNKKNLVDTLEWYCGLQNVNVQMIRKDSGKYIGLCSCIFAVGSKDEMLYAIQKLNSLPYEDISHLLGAGQWALNAGEAYLPGAKRLHHVLTVPEILVPSAAVMNSAKLALV